MTQNLKIDVYVEVICPWCLIGKRNLASALAQLKQTDPQLNVQLQWHTMQLIPQVPAEGWSYVDFYQRRLGGPEAMKQRQAQVRASAAQAGVEIAFDRIQVFPNTTLSHRLIAFAQQQPCGAEAMLERLLQAYFQRGENIGDVDTLLAIAQELGLDREAAAASLRDATASAGDAHGISGVPFFVFNDQFALSGAQPPEMLLSAIRHSVEAGATA
jgi:predicted DsbA family dithiol-disulfide isomerase